VEKTVIGVGQTGTRLAAMYAQKGDALLTFNTDPRDSGGIRLGTDRIITNGGAGQNYSRGLKIWADGREKLERYLEPIVDKDVVYFVAAGGGSGSSSVVTFLNILLRQKNRILLVAVLPFLKESIPATANATRVLSRLAEFSNNMSVFIVSNDEVSKELDDRSLEKVNREIVESTHLLTDLINYHEDRHFTPFAIDEADHRSIVYSGGFINYSIDDFDGENEEGPRMPKFSYGNPREASNILITRFLDTRMNNEQAMTEGDKLMNIVTKVAGIKGARIIYGIVRSNKILPKYLTIASGLKIDKVFAKLKGQATDSAVKYTEKTAFKETRKLQKEEDKLLNI
jgi:cell division GTPase FtsZ